MGDHYSRDGGENYNSYGNRNISGALRWIRSGEDLLNQELVTDTWTTRYSLGSLGLSFTGDTRYIEQSWVPSNGLRVTATNPATYVSHGASAAWEFTDNTTDQIVGNAAFPGDWDTSTTGSVMFCAGWSSPTTSQTCVWRLIWGSTAIGDDTTASVGSVSFEGTSSANANGLVVTSITLTGLGATDVCIHFTLQRTGGVGSDTLGAVAHLHGITLLTISDKLGGAL